jgi:hypothetical protein
MQYPLFFRNLGFLLLALILAGCGNAYKKSPTAAADAFFTLLNQGQYPEAYKSASFAFQAQQSVPAFVATAKDLGLGNYPSRSWTEKSASEKEALLDGDFTSSTGEKLSLQVAMLKESGKWRVFAIRTPAPNGKNHLVDRFNQIGRSQTFGDVFSRKVPSDDEARALVDNTMQQFNAGLHKKDFADFYLTTSALWRSETSKEKVESAFQSFVDANISIDPYKDTKAVFEEPPRLNSEGMLVVKGYYPTKPNRIFFDLRYTFELPKWKLLAITISIKP